MSKKNYIAKVKISVKNGSEADIKSTPGLNAALGQKQVNPKNFIDEFKKNAAKFPAGAMLNVKIYTQPANKFFLEIKEVSTTTLIKEAAKIQKGSAKAKLNIISSISIDQAKAIAQKKVNDLGASSVEAALKNIVATATSMGVQVK